ncbi:Plasmid stabilisation system protein [[Eubacterium] contortum]|uniref:Plasmid stabilisation system protein n=1 Tax=Faecalicatena contorta TaxID=39482 RepID=A0A174MI89_9FIRM|nr:MULTISPECIES: type II toxin-antitoxin system RelE/ParE family toxin [Clostridia]CUP33930.1 Plasmid stabilisation system protein [[Eubacterium] contortum] [Faecalicatena contorta]
MAYKLKISEEARLQLKEIIEYMTLKLRNSKAATDFLNTLEKKYDQLCLNPEMYEYTNDMRLRSLGYRRMPVDNYIVLYLVDKDKTEIQIDGIFYSKYNYRNDR